MAERTLAMCFAGAVGGSLLEAKVMAPAVPFLYEPSDVLPGLPRAFGLVVFLLTFFSFWLVVFGMRVGKARTACREAAEKDGETDLDRYMLPNLYVSGTSKHAKAFNSVQRAHQQVFEALTQYYMASLMAAMCFPVTTAISCALWIHARMHWSEDYATGGPSHRYNGKLSRFIWLSLIANYILSFIVAIQFIFGKMY